MTLRQKQSLFAYLAAKLILKIYDSNYEVTFGEAERPKITAEYYAKIGKGIKNSNHRVRLAIDLNLFKDGVYLTTEEHHRQFGEWWEQQHEFCRWGGRFGDPNHYSFVHEGVM